MSIYHVPDFFLLEFSGKPLNDLELCSHVIRIAFLNHLGGWSEKKSGMKKEKSGVNPTAVIEGRNDECLN